MPTGSIKVKIVNNIPKKSRKYLKILDKQVDKALRESGDKILANSQKRFSSNYSGGKSASVLAAIANAGVLVKQSGDGRTTLFIASLDRMDSATAMAPTKAEGNLYHFWRLLHAGWGMRGNDSNKDIFNKAKRSSRYAAQVIVQTSVLEPIYSPGRHAPFFELLSLEGLPGISVIRHPGFRGHEWFVNNLDLFDEDFSFLIKRLNKALLDTATLAI